MWIALVVGIVAGWALLAVLVALAMGRAVRVAEQRRPRARRPARTVLGRTVQLMTGQIPVMGARTLKAVTGAVPIIRPRNG
ncbi:hypothetical protein [Amnibacterium soli]